MNARIVLACAGLALIGCGGAKPAMAPSGGTEAPPSTHTEAVPNEPGADKAVVPVSPAQADAATAQASFDEASSAFSAAGSDCASMCKALASMQRATDRLCELAKDGGDLDQKRCTDARTAVTDAGTKVKSTCGGCG